MSEFTKGKWFLGALGGVIWANGKAIALVCHAERNREVFTDEGLANARLIAAAPEMYDELYEALQLLKGKSSYDTDEFARQAASIEELLTRIDGKEAEA